MNTAETYSMRLRGEVIKSDSLAALSCLYCKRRDDSGEGASTFPTPQIRQGSKQIGRISYNGRVWDQAGVLLHPLKGA